MSKYLRSVRKVAPYLNIGGMFAGCMVAGVLLGLWLDEEWGTKPWMLLGGCLLGMVAGFYHFFKIVLRIDKKKDDREIHKKD